MRQLFLSLLLPLALALAGCGLASFDIPITDTILIEPGDPSDTSETLELPDRFKEIRLAKTKEFEDSGFGIKDVNAVKLSSARIRVLTPGMTLDFLESAEFFVEGPGLEKRRIGTLSNIPAGAVSANVRVDDVNLKRFAMLDSMTVSATAVRGELSEEVEIEFRAVFHVDIL